MKQMIKNTLVIITLLLMSLGAAADGLIVNKIITIDGTPSSEDVAGTVTLSSGEITITPKSGYYFSLVDPNDLIVKKVIDGDYAQTRNVDFDAPLDVKAKDATADPSGETKYTFTVPGDEYDYEITANFHTRTSIESGYTISIESGPGTDGHYIYDGSQIKPTVTLSIGSTTLTEDTNFTVTYEDNIDAGTGKITLEGIRKYNGKLTGAGDNGLTALQFTIDPKPISGVTINLTPENFVYNGENQKPEVSVKDGDKDLVLDTDYTLTNEGGTKPDEYSVTITGKGNYDPNTTASKKYNITVLETTPMVALKNPNEAIVYDGKEKKPEVKVSVMTTNGTNPLELTIDQDYDVAYSDNVNAGDNTAKATVTLKGNYMGTATLTFTIAKAAGSIKFATGSYNKTFGDGDFTQKANNVGDGSVRYSSNNKSAATVDANSGTVHIVGAGEATITATVTEKAGGNYAYAKKTASYKVIVADAVMTVTATGYTGTYDGQKHGISVSAPADATVSYGENAGTYNLQASPTYANAGNYTVYYQVTKPNFTTVTGSAQVTINKAAGSISFATASYNKTFGDADFTQTANVVGDGSVRYSSDNGSVAIVDVTSGLVYIVGAGEATITATVTEKAGGNYAYAQKTASYKVIVAPAQEEEPQEEEKPVEPVVEYRVIIALSSYGEIVSNKILSEAGQQVNLKPLPGEDCELAEISVIDGNGKSITVNRFDDSNEGTIWYFIMPKSSVVVYGSFKGTNGVVDEESPVFSGGEQFFKLTDGLGGLVFTNEEDVAVSLSLNANIFAKPVDDGSLMVRMGEDLRLALTGVKTDNWLTIDFDGRIQFDDANDVVMVNNDSRAFTRGESMDVVSGEAYRVLRDCDLRLTLKTSEGPVVIRSITIVHEEPVSVIGVESLEQAIENWYDLSGRKLSGKPTKKGLYIRNGKKTVIK